MNLSRYGKSITALVAGVLGWWNDIIGGSAAVTAKEWHRLGVVVAVALGVYGVPNAAKVVQRASGFVRGDQSWSTPPVPSEPTTSVAGGSYEPPPVLEPPHREGYPPAEDIS